MENCPARSWRDYRSCSDEETMVASGVKRYPEPDVSMFARLRAAESIGRPLGDDRFLARIERLTSRSLKPRKSGPKPGVQVQAKGN
jgi:hypothetical protein